MSLILSRQSRVTLVSRYGIPVIELTDPWFPIDRLKNTYFVRYLGYVYHNLITILRTIYDYLYINEK